MQQCYYCCIILFLTSFLGTFHGESSGPVVGRRPHDAVGVGALGALKLGVACRPPPPFILKTPVLISASIFLFHFHFACDELNNAVEQKEIPREGQESAEIFRSVVLSSGC